MLSFTFEINNEISSPIILPGAGIKQATFSLRGDYVTSGSGLFLREKNFLFQILEFYKMDGINEKTICGLTYSAEKRQLYWLNVKKLSVQVQKL
jgi:hypothetical protein